MDWTLPLAVAVVVGLSVGSVLLQRYLQNRTAASDVEVSPESLRRRWIIVGAVLALVVIAGIVALFVRP